MMSPGDSVPFDATWYPSKTTHDVMGQGLICVTPPLCLLKGRANGCCCLVSVKCWLCSVGDRFLSSCRLTATIGDGFTLAVFVCLIKDLSNTLVFIYVWHFFGERVGVLYTSYPFTGGPLLKKKRGGLQILISYPPHPHNYWAMDVGKRPLFSSTWRQGALQGGTPPPPGKVLPPC